VNPTYPTYPGELPPLTPEAASGSQVTLALLAQAQAQVALSNTLQAAWQAATQQDKETFARGILQQAIHSISQDHALRYALGGFLSTVIRADEFRALIKLETREELVADIVVAVRKFLNDSNNSWEIRDAMREGLRAFLQQVLPEAIVELKKQDAVEALAK
jgi:hypothetical protein